MSSIDSKAAVLAADAKRYTSMIECDTQRLSAVLADDLIYMHSTGAIDTKSSLMAALVEKKFTFKSAETAETVVRIYGETAVLNGKVRMVVEVAGTDHHAFSGFTTVWVFRDGNWCLVHWQSTPLPKN
jgi:hypothetical protein